MTADVLPRVGGAGVNVDAAQQRRWRLGVEERVKLPAIVVMTMGLNRDAIGDLLIEHYCQFPSLTGLVSVHRLMLDTHRLWAQRAASWMRVSGCPELVEPLWRDMAQLAFVVINDPPKSQISAVGGGGYFLPWPTTLWGPFDAALRTMYLVCAEQYRFHVCADGCQSIETPEVDRWPCC